MLLSILQHATIYKTIYAIQYASTRNNRKIVPLPIIKYLSLEQEGDEKSQRLPKTVVAKGCFFVRGENDAVESWKKGEQCITLRLSRKKGLTTACSHAIYGIRDSDMGGRKKRRTPTSPEFHLGRAVTIHLPNHRSKQEWVGVRR
jgi:hypothetical protein